MELMSEPLQAESSTWQREGLPDRGQAVPYHAEWYASKTVNRDLY